MEPLKVKNGKKEIAVVDTIYFYKSLHWCYERYIAIAFYISLSLPGPGIHVITPDIRILANEMRSKSNNIPGSRRNLQPPIMNNVNRSPSGSPLARPSGPAPKPPGLMGVSPRPRGAMGPQFRPPVAQPVTNPGFPRPPVGRMPLNPGGGPPAFRLPGMGNPPIQAVQPPPPPSDPCPDNQPSIGNGSLRSVNRPPATLPTKPPINRPKPTVPQVRALYG